MGFRRHLNLKRVLRIIVVLISLVFLFIYFTRIDFAQLTPLIRQIGWWFLLPFSMTGIAYFFSTWAWRYCFPASTFRIPLLRLFIIRQIGETLTTITPANIIGGEMAKLVLLNQEAIDSKSAVSSIFISRMINIMAILCIGFIGTFDYLSGHNGGSLGHYIVYLMATLFVLIFIFHTLFSRKLWLYYLISRIKINQRHKWFIKTRAYIFELNKCLHHFYKKQKSELALASLLTVFHWISGALEFYFLLHLLGYNASLADAIAIEAGVQIVKSAGAFVPAQIGVEEYATKVMLSVIGCASLEIWIAVCLLRRLRQVIWLGFGGLLIWVNGFKQKKQIYGNLIRIS